MQTQQLRSGKHFEKPYRKGKNQSFQPNTTQTSELTSVEESIKLIPPEKNMTIFPGANSLLHDDVHLINQYGLLFLKQSLFSHLLKTSDSITINSSKPYGNGKTGNKTTILCVVNI